MHKHSPNTSLLVLILFSFRSLFVHGKEQIHQTLRPLRLSIDSQAKQYILFTPVRIHQPMYFARQRVLPSCYIQTKSHITQDSRQICLLRNLLSYQIKMKASQDTMRNGESSMNPHEDKMKIDYHFVRGKGCFWFYCNSLWSIFLTNCWYFHQTIDSRQVCRFMNQTRSLALPIDWFEGEYWGNK